METGYSQDQLLNWLPCQSKEKKGVILLGHGLNLNPYKMLPLSHFFQSLNFDVLLISLSGHRSGEDLSQVSYEKWYEEIKEATDTAFSIATKKNYAFYFCGFSLSCLLFQRVLQDFPYMVKKQVLLAPAIALKAPLEQIGFIQYFSFSLAMPSLIPLPYRQNYQTNFKSYASLLKTLSTFKNSKSRAHNIPTLVFCRKEDELVSLKKIKSIKQKCELHHWQIITCAKHKEIPWQHLLIGKDSMTEQDWENFTQKVRLFLT